MPLVTDPDYEMLLSFIKLRRPFGQTLLDKLS